MCWPWASKHRWSLPQAAVEIEAPAAAPEEAPLVAPATLPFRVFALRNPRERFHLEVASGHTEVYRSVALKNDSLKKLPHAGCPPLKRQLWQKK